jgi:tRNA (guanine-N7-)-methyltransferase
VNDNKAPPLPDAATNPIAAAALIGDTGLSNAGPGAAPSAVPHPRTIRSFVRRTGRTTLGQAKAFATQGPQFLVNYTPTLASVETLFDRSAPLILEIGFGMGEATAHIAALMPEKNFLCCEVHTPGVGALLKRIEEQQLDNIRILQHDAVEVLDHMLPANEAALLDGIHIFFPDPWHKKKHNKRRLIQAPLVAKLAARLKPGGYLHCATDWQPYAEQMLAVLSTEPLLVNTADTADASNGGYADKPAYRPLTKFENRGIKLGHGVWDVVFLRA